MKNFFLFDKELRWYRGLERRQQLTVTYAVLSAALLLTVSGGLAVEAALTVNMAVAVWMARDVDGSGLDE